MWQALIPLFGNIIDKVLPDPQAAADAKIKMLEMAQKGELAELSARAEIVKTEAASQSWLASSWRPITMLVFTGLIVARWFGWSAPNLSEAEYLKLWDIVELGLGGYVISRSVEKVVPHIAGAIKNR
jgi:hypothetical protein